MIEIQRIVINHKFQNLNQIINSSRSSYRYANIKKRKEEEIVRLQTLNVKPITTYPLKLVVIWYVKNKNRDLDGLTPKYIIDGLRYSGILKNDNLNCIEEITLKYKIDTTEKVELIFYKGD